MPVLLGRQPAGGLTENAPSKYGRRPTLVSVVPRPNARVARECSVPLASARVPAV